MRVFILSACFIMVSSAWATEPCGKEGSVEERIKSCNMAKGEFVLVTRDEKGLEIYKDTKTGMIWGDRINMDFNHYGSQKACSSDLPETELLKEVKWRLPTVREFEVAASHGMKEALPRMYHTFWTSTPVKIRRLYRRKAIPSQAFLWDGEEQRTDAGDLKDAASVRCIGKG